MSITTDKGTYTFCGYNVTLNSHAILLLNVAGNKYICFDRQNNDPANNRNIYDISRIRHWMNDLTCTDAVYYKGDTYAPVDFLTLINKVSDEEGLIRNISPTVNRTWVNANHAGKSTQALDTNNCEHLADKFWLLGRGHLNSSSTAYPDYKYDTTLFTNFVTNDTHIKFIMLSDGSVGGSAGSWWLRSASSSYDNCVGNVNTLGDAGNSRAYGYHGCSPAFQI